MASSSRATRAALAGRCSGFFSRRRRTRRSRLSGTSATSARSERGRFAPLEPAALAQLREERASGDVLEDEERRAVVLARLDERDDVRVRDPRLRLPLAAEARHEVVFPGEVARDDLERDRATL